MADNAKKITISIAGAEGKQDYKDVKLLPGTKVRDVLRELGLNGMQIGRPEGGAFDFNESLYDAVADGQKVYATKSNVVAG